ncbi:MAG: ribose transport system substrate-binding protein [Solirubrobacteraceae bacterium]|nr:ribose transport system substrate-binding protein [Solirubrobacteraceae bacterium]
MVTAWKVASRRLQRCRSPLALGMAVLGLALAVGACGSSGGGSGSDGSGSTAATTPAATTGGDDAAKKAADELAKLPRLDGKTVAYISILPIEYLSTSYNAARAAVEELGGKFEVYNSDADPNKELANVKTAIAKGADALLVFSTSPGAIPNIAKIAHAAKVPILHYYSYVDAVADKSVVDAWLGADATEIGRRVGELMASKLKSGDEVAAIKGFPGTAEVTLYQKGFEEVMKAKGIKVVAQPTSNWDRQKAFQEAQQILSRYPNIKGLFCHNDDTMAGCVSALRQAGKRPGDVVLATLNVSPTGIEFIKQGWMVGGVQQSPPLESAIGARLIAQMLAGEKPELQSVNRCWDDAATVTKDKLASLDPVTTWTFTKETIKEALVRPCVGQTSIFAAKGA